MFSLGLPRPRVVPPLPLDEGSPRPRWLSRRESEDGQREAKCPISPQEKQRRGPLLRSGVMLRKTEEACGKSLPVTGATRGMVGESLGVAAKTLN